MANISSGVDAIATVGAGAGGGEGSATGGGSLLAGTGLLDGGDVEGAGPEDEPRGVGEGDAEGDDAVPPPETLAGLPWRTVCTASEPSPSTSITAAAHTAAGGMSNAPLDRRERDRHTAAMTRMTAPRIKATNGAKTTITKAATAPAATKTANPARATAHRALERGLARPRGPGLGDASRRTMGPIFSGDSPVGEA